MWSQVRRTERYTRTENRWTRAESETLALRHPQCLLVVGLHANLYATRFMEPNKLDACPATVERSLCTRLDPEKIVFTATNCTSTQVHCIWGEGSEGTNYALSPSPVAFGNLASISLFFACSGMGDTSKGRRSRHCCVQQQPPSAKTVSLREEARKACEGRQLTAEEYVE